MISYEQNAKIIGKVFIVLLALLLLSVCTVALLLNLTAHQCRDVLLPEPGGDSPVMSRVSSTQPDIPPALSGYIQNELPVGYDWVEEEKDMVENPYFRSRTEYRITCYGPPQFPETNLTARGMSVRSGLDLADSLGLDGICAVSPDTPWYSRIRDENPPIIHVDNYGDYLVVDRTASSVSGVVDIYNPDLSPTNMWSEKREVYEHHVEGR